MNSKTKNILAPITLYDSSCSSLYEVNITVEAGDNIIDKIRQMLSNYKKHAIAYAKCGDIVYDVRMGKKISASLFNSQCSAISNTGHLFI